MLKPSVAATADSMANLATHILDTRVKFMIEHKTHRSAAISFVLNLATPREPAARDEQRH
jgi:hypothetical protein